VVSSVSDLLQLLESGITIGLVYGLVGLGYVTIYRTSGVVNFAQGEFVMLGGMMSYQFWTVWHLPYPVAMLLTVIAVPVIGVLFYEAVVGPLRRRHASVPILLMATIGLSFLVEAVATIVWTAYPIFGPTFSSVQTLRAGGVAVGTQDIWMIGVAIVLVCGLFYLTNRTRVGKAMTATATDPLAAGHVGIRAGSMIRLAFVISAIIGAVAGAAVSPIIPITTNMGTMLAVQGFVAAVIGGWGKPSGALVGGLVLGVVETLAGGFFPSGYKSAIGLLILLLVLYFRPSGILGASLTEAKS
jgi:branched-chain amino acid transport system permease protein